MSGTVSTGQSRAAGYYRNRYVRARMLEFLGGDQVETVTTEYVTGGDAETSHHREPRSVSDLESLWRNEFDIGRSLWDRQSLIIDLDIEYVNFDSGAEPYLHPARIFELQRPVEHSIEANLLDYGIVPLHLLSGRGHHFLWSIPRHSDAAKRLAALARITPSLVALNARRHRPNNAPIEPELGAAFAGAGLVVEYLAHRIKEEAAPMSEIPVELTAIEVGPSEWGREMVSIDISEYGDPLSTRVVRVPFSLYLKPQQQRGALGNELVEKLPPVFCVPLHEMDSQRGIQLMHDTGKVCDLARRATAKIPDQNRGTQLLIHAYEHSALRRFHDWFYSEEQAPAEKWSELYDRIPMEVLPLCIREILEHPNDLLLRPAHIRRVVRVMLALGWHPRQIAGLLASKFQRDYGWGGAWAGYDPATRADFYTRIFSGLFVTGRDDLVDFNCRSAQEARLCSANQCPFNLEQYRTSLLDRRKYERLACRPFNGLFLSDEHL